MAAEIKFKYPQPFTWAQVMDLDIGTISQGTQLPRSGGTEERDSDRLIVQEITRLQHSLDHLKSTQDQLQYLVDTTSDSTPDPDFLGAIQENKDVMCGGFLGRGYPLGVADSIAPFRNSQEERVSILKHALIQKGVISPSHYDLDPRRTTQPASTTVNPEPDPPSTTGGDGGLYL